MDETESKKSKSLFEIFKDNQPKRKSYLVVKQDTVLQATGYIVQAENAEVAKSLVNDGYYIEETKAEILDTLESVIVDVTEIGEKMKSDLDKARDGAVNTFIQAVLNIKHTDFTRRDGMSTVISYSNDFVDAMARYTNMLKDFEAETGGK